MADELMSIPNDDAQKYALNEPTNQNSTKVPKVVKPTKKKRYYKLWGLE